MATFSNHQIKQINLTLVPSSPVDVNGIQADKITAKLISLFPDSKIAKTQLPEILLLLDPVNQISVNVIQNENRIIIGSNKPSPYTEIQLDNFLRFCIECAKLVNQNDIRAYGFNISSVLDIDKVEDSGKYIGDILIKPIEKFEHPISAAGTKLIYVDGDSRIQLNLEPRFGKDLEPTKSIIVGLNVHRTGPLPEYSDLLEKCRKDYSDLEQSLAKILT